MPLCCQNISGTPSNAADKASYWGTLNGPCDIPEHTIDNLLEHLSQQPVSTDCRLNNSYYYNSYYWIIMVLFCDYLHFLTPNIDCYF